MGGVGKSDVSPPPLLLDPPYMLANALRKMLKEGEACCAILQQSDPLPFSKFLRFYCYSHSNDKNVYLF